MQPYAALSGNSGVRAFGERNGSIVVEFTDGSRYLYNAERPGLLHVKAMVRLAHAGFGLTTYINKHVRDRFAERLR